MKDIDIITIKSKDGKTLAVFRNLSGQLEQVDCKCPDCYIEYKMFMPIEFIESPEAWKENNLFMVLCSKCYKVRINKKGGNNNV